MSDFIPKKQHLGEVLIFYLILRKVQQKVTQFMLRFKLKILHLKAFEESDSEDLRTMTSTLKTKNTKHQNDLKTKIS